MHNSVRVAGAHAKNPQSSCQPALPRKPTWHVATGMAGSSPWAGGKHPGIVLVTAKQWLSISVLHVVSKVNTPACHTGINAIAQYCWGAGLSFSLFLPQNQLIIRVLNQNLWVVWRWRFIILLPSKWGLIHILLYLFYWFFKGLGRDL